MPGEKTDELRERVKQLEDEIGGLKDGLKESDKYAAIASRFAAAVIDIVLVSFVAWVIFIVSSMVIEAFGEVSPAVSDNDLIYPVITFSVFLFAMLIPFVYFMILEGGIGKGQTVGKRLLHIKVINENGGTPSYLQSFIRTFTRAIDFFSFSHIIGLIAAAVTDRRQRVGDILAKTLVVKENVESPPKSKAEKQSGFVVVILAIFVIFMLIFVVLIVGIVLWQLGIFSGLGEGANESIGFSGAKLSMIDSSIKCTTDGAVSAILINQAGSPLTDIKINVESAGTACTNAVPYNIPPGAQQQMSLTGCETGYFGDELTFEVTAAYKETVAGTAITRTQTGEIICILE